MYLRPKQICVLLISGDMKLQDVPDCEYGNGTIKSHVESMLNDMLNDGSLSKEKYDAIAGRYDPFSDDESAPKRKRSKEQMDG